MEPELRDDRDVLQDDSSLRSMHVPELPAEHEAQEDRGQIVREGMRKYLFSNWAEARNVPANNGPNKLLITSIQKHYLQSGFLPVFAIT